MDALLFPPGLVGERDANAFGATAHTSLKRSAAKRSATGVGDFHERENRPSGNCSRNSRGLCLPSFVPSRSCVDFLNKPGLCFAFPAFPLQLLGLTFTGKGENR